MKFIKSKLFIGIVCFIMAILIGFVGVPLVNKITNETVPVVRFKEDIEKGTLLSSQNIEIVHVPPTGLPANTLSELSQVIDKYIVTDAQAGDYVTSKKLSHTHPYSNDYLFDIPKGQLAVSFTIDTFAAGLSGKVLQGDIISLFTVVGDAQNLTQAEQVAAENHPALSYLKVLSATSATGIDTDGEIQDKDGNVLLPATVTVLANTEQSKLIAGLEQNGTIQVAVVSRGNPEYEEELLRVQQDYFDQVLSEEREQKEKAEQDRLAALQPPAEEISPLEEEKNNGK